MMKQNRFEIKLESTVDNLPVIADFVDQALANFEADPATVYKIQLSIDEACTNVIKHAYEGKGGPLFLALELSGSKIIITLQDKGTPFDPTSIPAPDLSADLEERAIGGLGIYFMQKLMDSVQYSFSKTEGNKLTMIKSLTPPPQTEKATST